MCEKSDGKCSKTGADCKCEPGLTQDDVKEYFDYDQQTGSLTWKRPLYNYIKVGAPVGKRRKDGSISVWIKNKIYTVQILVWLWYHGSMPKSIPVNIDRDISNTRIDNLQDLEAQLPDVKNIDGVVFFDKARGWRVSIRINGIIEDLGIHSDFNEAVCVRLAAEQCLDWVGCHSKRPAYMYVKINVQHRSV